MSLLWWRVESKCLYFCVCVKPFLSSGVVCWPRWWHHERARWWPVLTGWYWLIQSLSHRQTLSRCMYQTGCRESSSETWGTHTVLHTPLCLAANNRPQWGLICSHGCSISHNSAHSPKPHHHFSVLFTPQQDWISPFLRATKSVLQQGSLNPSGVFRNFSCIRYFGAWQRVRMGYKENVTKGHEKHMLCYTPHLIEQRCPILMLRMSSRTGQRWVKRWITYCYKFQELFEPLGHQLQVLGTNYDIIVWDSNNVWDQAKICLKFYFGNITSSGFPHSVL